jgi:hypothetical protein
MEHKVHDGEVRCMAVSGDRIVTCEDEGAIRVLNVYTCLLVLP